jgi:hypothetical protein
MLEFLRAALESGQHKVQVVGIGGVSQWVVDHDSFIKALLGVVETAVETAYPVTKPILDAALPVVDQVVHAYSEGTQAGTVAPMNPVPTPEQIAAYLRENPTAGMTLHDASPVEGMESTASNVTGKLAVPLAAGDPHPVTGAPITAEQAASLASGFVQQ